MLDLRSRLQGEFECLLELKKEYEKEKVVSQMQVAMELETLTSRHKALMEKYEREIQELRQQLETKENSGTVLSLKHDN
jgi:hypothetical protein